MMVTYEDNQLTPFQDLRKASSKKYYNKNRAYLIAKSKLNHQQNRDKKLEYAKIYRLEVKAKKLLKENEEIKLRKLTLHF